MANKNVADLMQHSAQVHDNDYIHNDFGKYIMGYQELARLSSEQSQDPTVQARIEQLSQKYVNIAFNSNSPKMGIQIYMNSIILSLLMWREKIIGC